MKIFYCLFSLTLLLLQNKASSQSAKYLIQFTDKSGSPFSVGKPSQFLSSKSIERRSRQNISFDETDLPINPAYLDSLRLAGNVNLLNISKWLNQVCITTDDPSALRRIHSFLFVSDTRPLQRPVGSLSGGSNKSEKETEITNTPALTENFNGVHDFYSYGNATAQIHIHEGEYLHEKGFHGEGMLVAVLDAGFYHYLSLPAFDSARKNNQIADTHDFVTNDSNVDDDNPHGMYCLSIMASNIPGQLIGSSPKAYYYLYRTEDAASEKLIEEQNWVAAAERADSIGVDVISTSLGYSTFDNSAFDHTRADMDGNTTIISRAADLAAKKGMIVIASAGNEGNKPWHFITAPADADSILAVGATDGQGMVGNFSSYGPSADGQIKPDIASVGINTALSTSTGAIGAGNGTSFAAPNVAGLITCLWQAFPEFTNIEVMSAVRESSNHFNAPDDRTGYGIPNFRIAFEDLKTKRLLKNATVLLGNSYLKVLPNPFNSQFSVLINPSHSGTAAFSIHDATGRSLLKKNVSVQEGQAQLILFDNLPLIGKGLYFLSYTGKGEKQTIKILRN